MGTNHGANRGKARLPDGRFFGVADNDEIAATMSVMGFRLEEIAEAIGVKTAMGASHAVARGKLNHPPADLDELRVTEAMRLDALERRAWQYEGMTNYHFAANGQIVRGPDGQPLIDTEPNERAIELIRKISEARRKLLGLDAPKRSQLTIDTVNAEVRRLEIELDIKSKDALPAAPAAIEAPPPVPAVQNVSADIMNSDDDSEDDEPEDEPAARPQPQRYERGGPQNAPPPLPVTDGGRRPDQPAEDYAEAYPPDQPQPEPHQRKLVPVDGMAGWSKSERVTSWG